MVEKQGIVLYIEAYCNKIPKKVVAANLQSESKFAAAML